MGIFDDNPPQGMERGKRGWLVPKPSSQLKRVSELKQENAELKSRLEQLESMVEQLVSKKKK